MRTRLFLTVLLVAICFSASAEWTWVKTIDVSGVLPAGSRVKDLEADAYGNLYFTGYFGTGNVNQIWKIANPITGDPPAITVFNTDGGYASTNAAHLAINPFESSNVFLCFDSGSEADSWIKKYLPNGNLDTSFGSGGVLSPVVLNGTNMRPRAIAYTGGTNKLLVSVFVSTNENYLGILDADTGADGGAVIATLSDRNDDGTVAESEVFQGIAYDPVGNAIYGNAMGDLIKVTGPSATLDDLSTFTDFTGVCLHPRINNSARGLGYLANRKWIAYTALMGDANAMQIGVYNIDAATEEFAGNASTEDGYINEGGACAIFEHDGATYVGAVDYYGNAIEIFTGNTPVTDWNEY